MKGYNKIKELIEGELEDYGHFKIGELNWNDEYGSFSEEDKEEHYIIDIEHGFEGKSKTLRFNYNRTKDEIEIELGEDSWYKVCDYDYTIKHFWMALLEW